MPVVGIPGDSTYVTLTRDELIEMAHKVIGVLEQGQQLDGDQLEDGIRFLRLIVRETDASGKWVWTIDAERHIPITANTYVYGIDQGLPSNIAELLTAYYRDSNGYDRPLDIYKAERYEAIVNKIQAGEPKAVYLTDRTDLSLRTLHTWPSLSSANTQSQISGPYRCIRSHRSSAASEPVTGANWRVFWEPGGTGETPWAADTDYTAPPSIRLLYRRPITDFAAANSPPDFPLQWPRLLMYKLAFDLGGVYRIPAEERVEMIEAAKGSFSDIFRSTKVKSNTLHNKAKYF